MRRPALLVLAALAAAPRARADALEALEAEQSALYERIAPGVVVVSARGTIGAGFAVAPGLVVTAAHVVPEAEAEVTLRDGRTVRGVVVERGANGLDVALLRVPAEPTPLALAWSDAIRPGSIVATVGHADGSRFVLGLGLVAQARDDSADAALVRLQLPLRAGASGGPVVSRSGQVVGIVLLGAPGTVTFALRMEAAARALAGLADVPFTLAEPSVARGPQPADVVPLSGAVPAETHGAGDVGDETPPRVHAPVLVTAPSAASGTRHSRIAGWRAPRPVAAWTAPTVSAPTLVDEPAVAPRPAAAADDPPASERGADGRREELVPQLLLGAAGIAAALLAALVAGRGRARPAPGAPRPGG